VTATAVATFAVAVDPAGGTAQDVGTALAVGVPVTAAMVATRMGDVWFIAPADVMRTVGPLVTLRGDRASALAKSAIGGFAHAALT
jgi:hypothetical protein